jgi:hypothetical protein
VSTASKKFGPQMAWIDAILEAHRGVHKKQRHSDLRKEHREIYRRVSGSELRPGRHGRSKGGVTAVYGATICVRKCVNQDEKRAP